MTYDEFLSLIEEHDRSNDGFWKEAEAAKVMPIRDVTSEYKEGLHNDNNRKAKGSGSNGDAGINVDSDSSRLGKAA